jgi:catechol 2,3-dioxygenase-like lactoylglutathione lyase family enzyme
MAAHPNGVRFEGSQPILRVENVQAALRFYVDVLGFENAHWGTEDFTSISWDRAAIWAVKVAAARRSGSAWRTPKNCTTI